MRLAPGTVVLVDEAGMVGTRDLAALADAASAADAKLVLVGDDRQLPEIEAGGAFRALGESLGAHRLREVRRQHDDWDREALANLRDGDIEAFARACEAHGRLVAALNAEAARAAMVQDWWAAHETGASALMLAHRRSDVRDLDARARERMRAAGRLGPDQLHAGVRAFAVGDRVVTKRNDRRQDLINGERGEILAIDETTVSVRFDGGQTRRIAFPYAEAGHLDHGYASTAHRAQGATVDRTFVLGSDELYREWGYTALSRHRVSARFYVTAAREFLNAPARPLEAGPDASRRVARLLATSRGQAARRRTGFDRCVEPPRAAGAPARPRSAGTRRRQPRPVDGPRPGAVTLAMPDGISLPELAREVAALLRRDAVAPEDRLLTAREVAERFNVNRGWVYAHARELGVIRIGGGARPRLRFDPAVVAQHVLPSTPGPTAERLPAPNTTSPLLPITPSRRRLAKRS